MSVKLKVMPLALMQIIASGAFSVAMAPVMAQTATTDQQPVQRIEITGSNIRRADAETPAPVQVISSEELKNSGFTSVAQVLQNITANGQDTLNQGFSQAFAAGASAISLRGLGTAATLVLIDGHRVAPYALTDDNQHTFVDISNIPFDAVERIEVLKDGASAVYGSDAMAGVVNIILKRNFVGTTVSAEVGTATEGGGTTSHATLSHGMGDYDTDGYNAYVTLEVRHQDPIYETQREGDGEWTRTDWTALGGNNRIFGAGNSLTVTNPIPYNQPYLQGPSGAFTAANTAFYPGACNFAALTSNACTWIPPKAELEPATTNVNILGSFTKKLADDWKLDVKASLFVSTDQILSGGNAVPQFQTGFAPIIAVGPGIVPHVGSPGVTSLTVPATYPGNPFGAPANVFGTIPGAPTVEDGVDSRAYRVVADLSGSIGAWDIDASVGYSRDGTAQEILGSLNPVALNNALNAPNGSPGQYLMTGPNSAALMSQIFPSTNSYDISELEFGELHASRSLMQLPGGDLGFSAGVSYTHSSLNSPAPLLVQEGVVVGNNAFVEGALSDAAAYMELVAPVLKTLEIEGDVRYDHFDTVGGNTVPKIGFKWTPNSVFALRGTASEGFRAPNAAESVSSGGAYFGVNATDPVLCPTGQPTAGAVVLVNGVNPCSFDKAFLSTANPSLKPEKSVSETLGVILEPIKGWSSTVDLYQIKIKDQILGGNLGATVRQSTPASALCADGNGGTYACTVGPNGGAIYPILYTETTYENASQTTTSGIELDSRYKFKLGEYGSLTADLNWNHMMSYIIQFPGESFQLAGTHGPSFNGGDTANPKDRIAASFTWNQGPWQVATIFNWISGYTITDPSAIAFWGFPMDTCAEVGSTIGVYPGSTPQTQNCRVDSFLTTNVTAHYKLNKHWNLHASIDNLFNTQPPVDNSTYGNALFPYNPSMHQAGAIGRFVNVGAVYNF